MGQKRVLFLLGSLFFWVIITALTEKLDLDRQIISKYFYTTEGGFFRAQEPLFLFLFQKGTYLGPVLTLVALFCWVGGYFKANLYKFQRQWLVILLTAIIGGGILVNGFLKDYWGRPRPREVVTFNGLWPYHPISQPGTPGKGKSFPCGHCTSAFLATSLWVFIPTNPVLGTLAVVGGLTYGGLMSITRMAQGGHFPTDALWALGVVLQVSLLLHILIIRPGAQQSQRLLSKKGRIGLSIGVTLFVIGLTVAFMSRRPYFKSYHIDLAFGQTPQSLMLKINGQPDKLLVLYRPVEQPRIDVDVKGLGWTEATHRLEFWQSPGDQKITLKVRLIPIGYFSEIHNEVTLTLPASYENTVGIETMNQLEPPTQP